MRIFLVDSQIVDVVTKEKFTITQVYKNGVIAKMVDKNGNEKMISKPEVTAGHFRIKK